MLGRMGRERVAHSSSQRPKVLAQKSEKSGRRDYHISVVRQGLVQVPMKEGGQRPGGTTGGTSGDIKEVSPQAKIRSSVKHLRRHQTKPKQRGQKEGQTGYSLGKQRHGLACQTDRKARPSASGSFWSAISTMSTTFHTPQPPRVTSLRMPSPI